MQMEMRGKWISAILAFICIGFLVGSVISFAVPNRYEDTVESMSDLGIVENLTVPFPEIFPLSSYNQSIDITLTCTDGSIDILVMESTEWEAFVHSENYSAYFEAKNVTSVMTTVEIDPPSNHWIDIMLQTKYGGVNMSIIIISHWMRYDITTAMNSAFVAVPFGLAAFYYYPRKSKNNSETSDSSIS